MGDGGLCGHSAWDLERHLEVCDHSARCRRHFPIAHLTFDDALAWAKAHPACQGFTYQSADRRPTKPTRVWFKSRLRVLHADGWYTYSVGKQK